MTDTAPDSLQQPSSHNKRLLAGVIKGKSLYKDSVSCCSQRCTQSHQQVLSFVQWLVPPPLPAPRVNLPTDMEPPSRIMLSPMLRGCFPSSPSVSSVSAADPLFPAFSEFGSRAKLLLYVCARNALRLSGVGSIRNPTTPCDVCTGQECSAQLNKPDVGRALHRAIVTLLPPPISTYES